MASASALSMLLICSMVVLADNDIFGEELLDQDEEENQQHLASSVEDLGALLCQEQILLKSLTEFQKASQLYGEWL